MKVGKRKMADGGPVNPSVIDNTRGTESMEVHGVTIGAGKKVAFMGISIREHYAGLAMQSLANTFYQSGERTLVAEAAFQMADAMLAAGEVEPEQSAQPVNAQLLAALEGLYRYVGGHTCTEMLPDHPLEMAKRAIVVAGGKVD